MLFNLKEPRLFLFLRLSPMTHVKKVTKILFLKFLSLPVFDQYVTSGKGIRLMLRTQ